MTETALAEQLYACVNQAGNSVDKRRYLIDIPSIVGTLAKEIYNGNYYPERMTVFAIEDPKLREIFAPGFRDRLAQQWLVSIVAPNIERAWIDDSFSNRQGKGTHSALSRLQHFMRQTGHMYYCQMDIRAFFPSIHRPTLLKLWKDQLTRVSCAESTHQLIQQVAGRIILGASRQTLIAQQRAIDDFLHKHLHLQLNPNKTVLQRVNQGANFLGYIVFPHHCYIRDRTLRALRQRIYFFNHLLDPRHYPHVPRSARGSWPQWLVLHQLQAPITASPAVLKRMLATLNSYYGQLKHANSYYLRRAIYQQQLGGIQRYFLPTNSHYLQLRIKPVWLFPSQ